MYRYISIYLSSHIFPIKMSDHLRVFSHFHRPKPCRFSRQPNPSRPALRSGRHRPWLGAWSAILERGSWPFKDNQPSYITASTLITVI